MKSITTNLSVGLLLASLALAATTPSAAQEYTFTTLAGPDESPGALDGQGHAARFSGPSSVAVDGAGNVYVADIWNNTIRKVTVGGVVTTLAGLAGSTGGADGTGSAARFYGPSGVAVDSAGNVYVAEFYNSTIRKVTPAGMVTTLAGLAGSSGTNDGTGSAARFNGPNGVAVDSAGNVYVADPGNHAIRKVTPAAVVTTLAAYFGDPSGVAVDIAGNVYVADTEFSGNFYGMIFKVTPGGVVGKSIASWYGKAIGVAVDGAGNAYVGDSGNCAIQKVTPNGLVTTLAGGSSGSADGTGSAARFFGPQGVAVDSAGNIYVADLGNNAIRKVTSGGVVTTLAGLAGTWGSADGTGSAARFNGPQGATVDSTGNVYLADAGNDTIRKVTPAGVVTTLAGLAGQTGINDGTGSAARFNGPAGVAVDSASNVYVADTGDVAFPNNAIRKVTPAEVVTTLAGGGEHQAPTTARAAARSSTTHAAWRWTAPATSMWRTAKTTRFGR